MADCAGSLHERARRGFVLFNEGHYFEAHEELEAAWRDERGAIRQLYQGILEAAVTYLHITRNNYVGAFKVYGRSMRWLKDWPEHCRGIDVGQLRRDLAAAIEEMQRLGQAGAANFDRGLLKPLVWQKEANEQG